MKTQRENNRGICLQTKSNRWKWMAGATAATAAGVTASQAGTITVNLLNNYISATGGNHLNADLTGDGQPDLAIANAFNSVYYRTYISGALYVAAVNLNGVRARAFFHPYDQIGYVTLGSKSAYFFVPSVYAGYGTSKLVGSIPITFKDLHINGGRQTEGSLEVTVSGVYPKIQLDSFTYKTPDQGSSLALLAMGAGGILAFRRWRAAQERS